MVTMRKGAGGQKADGEDVSEHDDEFNGEQERNGPKEREDFKSRACWHRAGTYGRLLLHSITDRFMIFGRLILMELQQSPLPYLECLGSMTLLKRIRCLW